jgi:hypothetical protein
VGFKKYNWIGNKIDAADMSSLYQIKQKTKRPITELVAEAVKEYISKYKE